MAYTLNKKYIEPMAKGEKSHRHKRNDSGYAATSSDRIPRRYSDSRKSTESTSGSKGGYVDPEVTMANQVYNLSVLQNALQASNESKERLSSENHELKNKLLESTNESQRLRLERDEERRQNDQLRVAFDAAKKEIDHLRKESGAPAKHQKDRDSKKSESKKSSSKSSSSKDSSKSRPPPVYRESSVSPPPMARSTGGTSGSRPTTNRRMSVSSPQGPYATYTIRPANYGGQYPGQ